jgi:cbb3-type cytochrome oxidase maturation protein
LEAHRKEAHVDVVILLVFISLCLVAASLLFFFHRLRAGDFDHGERLALAPLDEEPMSPTIDGKDSGTEHPPISEVVSIEDMSLEHLEGGRSNARS